MRVSGLAAIGFPALNPRSLRERSDEAAFGGRGRALFNGGREQSMVFQAQAGLELNIDGSAYLVAEHPAAPGMPYGQEGRAAVVYQVVCGGERRALKVFKPRHQVPTLVYLAEQLRSFAGLPGLAVCARTVLTPQAHIALLRRYPELTYAVLMPWIEGPTWMQVLLEKRTLPAQTCLEVANHLAGILAGLEQRGLAHCDLSGPNVLLPGLAAGTGVALVDVEQMYGPELHRPPLYLAGRRATPPAAPQGLGARRQTGLPARSCWPRCWAGATRRFVRQRGARAISIRRGAGCRRAVAAAAGGAARTVGPGNCAPRPGGLELSHTGTVPQLWPVAGGAARART